MKKFALRNSFLILFLTLTTSTSAVGQFLSYMSDCLREAQKKYDQGQFYDIPGLIRTCPKNNSDKEYKFQLLALSYYHMKQLDEAEKFADSLIHTSPYLLENGKYPIELVRLLEGYRAKTRMVWELTIGLAFGQPTGYDDPALKQKFIPSYNLGAGIGLQIDLGKKNILGPEVDIGIGLEYQKYSYLRALDSLISFQGDYTLFNLAVPVKFVWNIPIIYRIRISPVIGINNTFQLNSIVDVNFPIQRNAYVGDLRKKYIPALLVGCRISKILNGVPAFVEFRYSGGLENALEGNPSISNYSSYPKEYAEQKFKMFGAMLTIGATMRSYVKKENR